MDEVLVAANVGLPLCVALIGAIWYLVASSRREQRKRAPMSHAFKGQGEAVTVAELLEEAVEQGDSIRLNWSVDDLDSFGRVRPYVQDEFPTAILPKVEDVREPGPDEWVEENEG
jgi:hypothetical protein